jgi:hypothetical protein
MGSLLVCNWPHSVGQNHFFEKMLFNRDSAFQKCFQKILHSLQGRKFGSLPAVRTTCHTVWTPICPKHQPSKRRVIPSGRRELPVWTFLCVSRSFDLIQSASVQTFQQHVQMTLSVRLSFRISFQNTDMGRLL